MVRENRFKPPAEVSSESKASHLAAASLPCQSPLPVEALTACDAPGKPACPAVQSSSPRASASSPRQASLPVRSTNSPYQQTADMLATGAVSSLKASGALGEAVALKVRTACVLCGGAAPAAWMARCKAGSCTPLPCKAACPPGPTSSKRTVVCSPSLAGGGRPAASGQWQDQVPAHRRQGEHCQVGTRCGTEGNVGLFRRCGYRRCRQHSHASLARPFLTQ